MAPLVPRITEALSNALTGPDANEHASGFGSGSGLRQTPPPGQTARDYIRSRGVAPVGAGQRSRMLTPAHESGVFLAQAQTAGPERPMHQIGDEIASDWKNPYFGAVPYIEAMRTMPSIDSPYGADPGDSIVAYFLSNATTWKGETARRVKGELRAMLKKRQ